MPLMYLKKHRFEHSGTKHVQPATGCNGGAEMEYRTSPSFTTFGWIETVAEQGNFGGAIFSKRRRAIFGYWGKVPNVVVNHAQNRAKR
jgi:hypothetical protein